MEGTSFAEDRAAVAAGAVTLRRLLGRLHQAGSGELGPLFAELDCLKALAEANEQLRQFPNATLSADVSQLIAEAKHTSARPEDH